MEGGRITGVPPDHPVSQGKLCPGWQAGLRAIIPIGWISLPVRKTYAGAFGAPTAPQGHLRQARTHVALTARHAAWRAAPTKRTTLPPTADRAVIGSPNIDHCARLRHGP